MFVLSERDRRYQTAEVSFPYKVSGLSLRDQHLIRVLLGAFPYRFIGHVQLGGEPGGRPTGGII